MREALKGNGAILPEVRVGDRGSQKSYFFRIPIDKLRPANCGLPSTTATSLSSFKTRSRSSWPISL